jgi:CRISPR-associated protein Csm1
MSTSLREKIYLAALLHDIGKFYQRADDIGAASSKELDQTVKNLEAYACPKNKEGFYTHKHVLWTAQFFIDQKLSEKGENDESLLQLASYHHKPASFNQSIVQYADHLSSGMDRTKDNSLKDEHATKDWNKFKKTRMKPVFEALFKKEKEGYKYELPVLPIEFSDTFFPQQGFDTVPDYSAAWNAFKLDIEKIKKDNLKVWGETMLSLLEKHTTTIPSSTINLPDISLYDHLKTTAAFAIALFDFASENNIQTIAELKQAKNPFLLIGADISGIQSYIYDIVSTYAAKNLKGRSFYLQLLSESIIQKVLSELNLFQSNVVYNSGGGFYILAPNTEQTKQKINSLKKEITRSIFNTHKTALFVAIDYEELSSETIFAQTINETWRNLNDKLNQSKRQRFKELLIDDFDLFFEPSGGKDYGRDAITGDAFDRADKVRHSKDGMQLHEATAKQIDLGKKLKNAHYWITSFEKLNYFSQDEFNPGDLGIYHYFISSGELAKQKENLSGSADNVLVKHINKLFFDKEIAGSNNQLSYVFYGGNDFPVDTDGVTPKTFNELGGDGSFKRIAILRMDVDNLGKAFIHGFSDGSKTFSRYSALSRNLDFFFKGYINKIWLEEKYKNHTFIIYSGGDDLFIVGKWDIIFDMAKRIYQDFRAWSCYNPNLTLSGGIAIVDEKYPIMKGAEEAGKAENLAKDFEYAGETKNALTLFGTPLSWYGDLPIVVEYKNRVKQLLEVEKGLPKAFVSKIYAYNENATYIEGKLRPLNILWMMAYDFGRMEKRIGNTEAKALLSEIKINVFANTYNNEPLVSTYHFLQLLQIAVRWAELELRTNN